MAPLRSTDVIDESAQLITERYEHLVFVFDRFYTYNQRNVASSTGVGNIQTVEERNQLLPGPLRS